MREIRRSPNARADLIALWNYIAEDNETAADMMLDRIQSALVMLCDQPYAGRARPELHEGLRSFPVGNYVLFYVAGETAITVIRVLSGYRDVSDEMMR